MQTKRSFWRITFASILWTAWVVYLVWLLAKETTQLASR